MKTPSWFLKKNLIAYLLLPASWIYFVISRAVYFSRSRLRSPVGVTMARQVICIGNILAGGVGKTPIVMEIAKRLKSPVVMRGYKGGDEAKMIEKAGISVYTGDRKANIELLNNQCPVPSAQCPIIMDDGFQNPTIKKDISILVFDGKIGVGNGFLLPAGPLREPISAIKRADAVIIIGENRAKLDLKNLIRLRQTSGGQEKVVFLAKSKTIMPETNGPIIAFAGIGYPQKFFDSLRGNVIKTISFPDHYQYNSADLKKLFALARSENAELLTTEKDWVRLPADAQKKIKIAKLETTIEPAFWEWLEEKLLRAKN